MLQEIGTDAFILELLVEAAAACGSSVRPRWDAIAAARCAGDTTAAGGKITTTKSANSTISVSDPQRAHSMHCLNVQHQEMEEIIENGNQRKIKRVGIIATIMTSHMQDVLVAVYTGQALRTSHIKGAQGSSTLAYKAGRYPKEAITHLAL